MQIEQVAIKISDVSLQLTQIQYTALMTIAQSVPRVLAADPDETVKRDLPEQAPITLTLPNESDKAGSSADLGPELRLPKADGSLRSWTTLDLVLTINVVKLRLYDGLATTSADLETHGIARFALNSNVLRFKMLSNSCCEAQVVLKSFTVSNTRPGDNKYREIIPAARNDRNQFMVLYTMAGDGSALAVVTIDSPKIIFSVEPVVALLEFFSSAQTEQPPAISSDTTVSAPPVDAGQARLDYRVDLHDVSISVLQHESDIDTPAIRLSINQVFLSQQVRVRSHL